jgi:hypothetical protein
VELVAGKEGKSLLKEKKLTPLIIVEVEGTF